MQAQIHRGTSAGDGQRWQAMSGSNFPMLILPKHGAPSDTQEQEIRRIQARNERVFRVFIIGSALLAALILLVMLLRWRM